MVLDLRDLLDLLEDVVREVRRVHLENRDLLVWLDVLGTKDLPDLQE